MNIDIEQLIKHCVADIVCWDRDQVANAIRQWWNKNKLTHALSKAEYCDEVSDGWGCTRNKCELKHMCQMSVIRPGDVRCECEENIAYTSQDISKMKMQLEYILNHLNLTNNDQSTKV